MDSQTSERSIVESYLVAIQEGHSGLLPDSPFNPSDSSVGFSGIQFLGVLQRLARVACKQADHCYLEVGVFRGLTLLSVAAVNSQADCYGIDDFSHHDPAGENRRVIEERSQKAGITNVHLIQSDFEAAFDSLPQHIGNRKIGCYLVDGPHDYRSQLVCLTLAHKYLGPNAVILVDDSNYEHVRRANKDFLLAFPEYKLAFEVYTRRHPSNARSGEESHMRQTWWNGLNIIVRDPGDTLLPIYPPVSEDRTRYFNDHLIHSSKMAEVGPAALRAVEAVFAPRHLPRRLAALGVQWQKKHHLWKDRERELNTYSAAIEGGRTASLRE